MNNSPFVVGGNSFKRSNNFTQTFTADNDGGTADISDVFVIRGMGKGSSVGLPAGVTIPAGDITDYGEAQDAFQQTPVQITSLTLESAAPANFDHMLEFYEKQFNGRDVAAEQILLSEHKDISGGVVANVLRIKFQEPILVTPRTVMKMQVSKNSSVKVTMYFNWQETFIPLASEEVVKQLTRTA